MMISKKKRFDSAIQYFNADIWGLGWQINKKLYHGKAWLFHVSSIYAKSRFGFGLMYPFQRGVTFSGRFWHAPLNGCYLFSEPGAYTKVVPGIIETDYSINDIEKKINMDYNPTALRREAEQFWNEQASITLHFVKISLPRISDRNYSLNVLFGYVRLFLMNELRRLYQYRFI